MWCIPQLDAEYVGKMEDVLKVYERPYNQAEPVVCLDEKPVSLHAEVRPSRPARPGCLAKRIANMSVVERLMFSAPSSPKRAVISPSLHRTDRALSSPK